MSPFTGCPFTLAAFPMSLLITVIMVAIGIIAISSPHLLFLDPLTCSSDTL